MVKRGLRYYWAVIWRYYLLGAPGILLDAVLPRVCPSQMKRGFRVLDPQPETRSQFETVVDAALALIAQFDQIRFRRVQAEIRSIVNAPALGSTYSRPLKVCSVDLRCCFDVDDPEMTVKFLASMLVYEATYGHLFGRGVLRSRRNCLRVDCFCCKEAQRFMHRLGMTDTPWDPKHLSPLSRWSSMRHSAKTLCGVFTRDAAAEAGVYKKAGMPRQNRRE